MAYLAPYVDPEATTLFSFLGLAYPVLLLINLFFIILWILLRKRYVLLSLLAVLVGWNMLLRHFNWGSSVNNEHASIKITSYNVQNLAKNNLHIQNPDHRSRIFRFLAEEQPEILCMQEFYYRGNNTSNLFKALKKETGLPHFFHKNYFPDSRHLNALVTFTSYPLINTGELTTENGRIFTIYTDLLIDNDTVRVYNVHLKSVRFQQSDLDFVNDLPRQASRQEKLTEGSKSVLIKLGEAFRKRAKEASILAGHIQTSPHPVILCGDFNDTPGSFSYEKIKGNLRDAFLEAGYGYGNTYAGKLPPIRIDFIFYDRGFTSRKFQIHTLNDLSDHYPVTTHLAPSQN